MMEKTLITDDSMIEMWITDQNHRFLYVKGGMCWNYPKTLGIKDSSTRNINIIVFLDTEVLDFKGFYIQYPVTVIY